MERWSEHTKRLSPLVIGGRVRIQNQTGNNPTRGPSCRGSSVCYESRWLWESNPICNKKFLMKYTPVYMHEPRQTISDDLCWRIPGPTQVTSPSAKPVQAWQTTPAALMPPPTTPIATPPPALPLPDLSPPTVGQTIGPTTHT